MHAPPAVAAAASPRTPRCAPPLTHSAPGPPPVLFVGNTPALTHAYYRTLYAHVAEPVSVFLVHATPFLFFNDLAAMQRVLSGGCASFI